MIKRFLIIAMVIGLLASCPDPASNHPNNKPVNPQNNTTIVFDNTQGICTVLVYDNYQRREEDKITEVPAGQLSEEIECDAPGTTVTFYFSYRVNFKDINGFTLVYVPKEIGLDQTSVRIDANTKKNIPIPKLNETFSSPDTLLSDNSYLLIQNNSSFSFRLHVGTSIITPDGLSDPLVNPGDPAQYTIIPGAASPYQLLVGADFISFSNSIVSFDAGHLYSFIFDGAISLITELELNVENVAGSIPNDIHLSAPLAPFVTAGDGLLTLSWTAVQGAENYEVYSSMTQQPPALPERTIRGTTVVLLGLKNKTPYYMWIKAINGSGASEFSPFSMGIPWPADEIPDTPGMPVIIPGINQLTVSWEQCGGADSYEVFINTTTTNLPSAAITTDKTDAIIKNLENNQIYYIWVRSVNSFGNSDFSLLVSGTPKIPTIAPSAPSRPVITAGSRELKLSWKAVELAGSYEVWLGTTDNSAQAQKHGDDIANGITETVISGLVNETVYYVWLKAKNIIGTSGFSPAVSAKPSAFTVLPETPAQPVAVPGSRSMKVSWPGIEGALSYELWMGQTNNQAGAEKKGGDITGTTVTLNSLINDTTYYIWIKAKNHIGVSELSPMTSGTPSAFAAIPPAPQTAPTIITGNGLLTASWQAVEGATSYEVWNGTSTNPVIATKSRDGVEVLSAVITGLTNKTQYYVWIKAKNDVGTSSFSPMATGTPSAFVDRPQSPSAPLITTGNGQIDVTWAAVEGTTAYEVWYGRENNSASAVKYGYDVTTSLSMSIYNLTNGNTYYVWIKAKNSIGASEFGPAASGKPIANATAPSVSASSGQLSVTWAAIAGADQYDVFCGTGINPPQNATQTVTGTSASISGLVNGTTYNVWVRGRNSTGTGAISAVASAKLVGNMGTVTLVSGNGKLTANWTAVAGADQYEAYYYTSDSIPDIFAQTVSTTTVTINGLTNGTTYYVWIKPKNASGTGNVNTSVSGVPMAIPESLVIVAGNQEITISWSPVPGANVYEIYYSATASIPAAPSFTNVNDLNKTITRLNNGTTYNFWVKAVNANGTSGASPMASGKPIGGMGMVTLALGNEQLTANWAAVIGADEYDVYCNTSSTIPENPAQTVAANTATITGLNNGTTYYVWVKGKNANGTSNASTAVSGKPLGNIGTVTLVSGNDQLTANWSAAAGADEYEVYRNTTNSMPASPSQTVSTNTVTISGLTNGTTYYLWVKGKNSTGTSGASTVVSGKPISNMGTVTLVLGESGELKLSWTAVAGADQYDVYQSTTSTMPGSPSQTITTTTVTISNLTNGTTYYFWVKPKNANGAGTVSTSVNGKPLGNMGTVTLVPGNGQLTASWSAVTGADQYEVFYNTANSIPASPSQSVSATTVVISSLSNGTTYYVWVKGKNTTGTNSATVVTGKPIGVMGTVTLVSGDGQLTASWSAVAGADQYEVYYNTTSTIPGSPAQTVSTNAATISNLTNSTTYYVWVKGKNSTGTNSASTAVSGVPMATPGNLTVSVGNQQITVSWATVPGASGYELYYGTGTTIPSTVSFSLTELSKTITSLNNGTTYYFWVKAVNANGTSGASPRANGKPIGNMGTVTLVSGDGQLTANWSAVAGADQYDVYQNTTSTIPGSPSQTVSTTTATISSLTNGTTYYVWVKGKNANGTNSASTAVSGKPLGNMGTVTLVLGNGQLTANWSAVTGADQYDVYYNTSNSIPASPSQTVTTNTITITDLTNGTTYFVWVKGKNTTGTNNASTVVSGKPLGVMGAVTLVSGNGQLTANWSAVAGADQYEVYYSTSSTITGSPSQTVSTNAATISSLTNGTTYYVWVKGKNANGTNSASTAVSGVPLATPGNLTVNAGYQQITVSWATVPGASSYEFYYGTSTTIPASPSQTVSITTITISSLTNGTTYYFWVKAVNANGTSVASPRASGKPIGNMGTVALVSGNGLLTASWSAVAGAEQYDVYYSINNSIPVSPAQTVTTNTTSISRLNYGTTYYVWVKPKNANGIGTENTAASLTVTGIEMVSISAGTFIMGSPTTEQYRGNDETQHSVTLSGFSMGKYQVTQALWLEVIGKTILEQQTWATTKTDDYGRGDNYPVYFVSWYYAIVFCNKLSLLEGLEPVYNIGGSNNPANWGTIPNALNSTWDAVVMDKSKNGYRLPTEAEWEYACRAGTATAYNTGDTIINNTGWYSSNSGGKTHEVGLKPANAWGLYDMHGNVEEWCWDWYDSSYYSSSPTNNPTGPVTGPFPQSSRVMRGGSWYHDGRNLRSACRWDNFPVNGFEYSGFRLVRSQ